MQKYYFYPLHLPQSSSQEDISDNALNYCVYSSPWDRGVEEFPHLEIDKKHWADSNQADSNLLDLLFHLPV